MSERDDPGAVGGDAELDDVTAPVIRARRAAQQDPAVDDTTVVVARRQPDPEPGEPDATVVVARAIPKAGPVDPDVTVVVARPRPDPEPADPDATVVVGRAHRARKDERREGSGPGEVVDTEGLSRAQPARSVYGARAVERISAPLAAESLTPTLEMPSPQQSPTERAGLPSLTRRFRRQRLRTLLVYAGAVLVSFAGLIVIARLVFSF